MQNKCLGVFLVVLAFPLVILSIFFISTNSLFKSSFYKNIFRSTDSYNKTSQIVSQSINKTNTQSGDFTIAIFQNADGAWYKTNVENNLDEFFLYVNNKKPQANFNIDLKPLGLKTILSKNSDLPKDAVNLIPDQLTFASYIQFMTDLKRIYSQNTDPSIASETVKKDLENIDTQIDQGKNLENKTNQNLSNIKNGFHYARIGIYIVYGLTILILVLIGVAARHYAPAIFRWVGEALVIPSAFIALISYFAAHLFTTTLNPISTAKFTIELKQLLSPIYISVVSVLSNDIMRISFIVGFVGLIFIIFSYILPKFIAKDIAA